MAKREKELNLEIIGHNLDEAIEELQKTRAEIARGELSEGALQG